MVVAADIMAEEAGVDFTEEPGADVHLAVAEVVEGLEAVVSAEVEVAAVVAELNHSAAEAAVGAVLSRTSDVRPAEVEVAFNFRRREVLAVVVEAEAVRGADRAASAEMQRRVGGKVLTNVSRTGNQCAPAATLLHEDRIANRCDQVGTPPRAGLAQTDSLCGRVGTFRRADQTASPCVPEVTTPRGGRIVSKISIPIAVP